MAAFGKSLSFSGGASGLGGTQGAGTTGGSLFGGFNQQANSTGLNLFGASSNDKRQRSGTATDSGQVGQAAGSGAGASADGLFGNNAQNAGAAGNNATSQVGGGLFGNTASTGAASGGGVLGSSFGSAATKPGTSSLFGTAPAGGIFGSANTAQQQQQQAVAQQPPQQQHASEADELSKQFLMIKECWDPASPYYQFRHYFYNVVEPGQVHMYQCPAGQDPMLWQQAQNDNPDPQTLVPVLASGFDDLRKRVDSQSLQMQSYQGRTAEVSEKLCAILQKHHSETTVRLLECRRRQAELSQRLLEFMKLLQLLRLRGQLLHPEEEVFRIRVEHLEKEMMRSGSLKQRLAELQDLIYRLQANARRRREMLGLSGNSSAFDGFEVADEAQLEYVMKMLSEKQRGLAHMTQVVSQDAQSLEEVENAIEERVVEVQKQREARERAQVAKSLALPW